VTPSYKIIISSCITEITSYDTFIPSFDDLTNTDLRHEGRTTDHDRDLASLNSKEKKGDSPISAGVELLSILEGTDVMDGHSVYHDETPHQKGKTLRRVSRTSFNRGSRAVTRRYSFDCNTLEEEAEHWALQMLTKLTMLSVR
jgi:hypothetical protein